MHIPLLDIFPEIKNYNTMSLYSITYVKIFFSKIKEISL